MFFFYKKTVNFFSNISCDGVKVFVDCANEMQQTTTNNDNLNIVKFLSRHRRASIDRTLSIPSSNLLFGVRLEIPIRRELIVNPKINPSNNSDKFNIINVIENEALFNNLFNLEQVINFFF